MKPKFFSLSFRFEFLFLLIIMATFFALWEILNDYAKVKKELETSQTKYVDRLVYLPRLSVPQLLPVIMKRQPKLDDNIALIIANIVIDVGERKKVSPLLILSIIENESSYNQMAVSKKGAIGLMQIMELWLGSEEAKSLNIKNRIQLFQIRHNVELGTLIICKLLIQYETQKEAFAHYYGSKDVDQYYDRLMKTIGEMVVMLNF